MLQNYKTTAGCLVYHREKLLMVLETQDGIESWDIPAGGIETGENPDEAVRRELAEEVGLAEYHDLRFKKVLWSATQSGVVIHFLYELHLDDSAVHEFKPFTADIRQVKLFTRDEIGALLENGEYEHDLARERLLYFYDAGREADSSLQIIST